MGWVRGLAHDGAPHIPIIILFRGVGPTHYKLVSRNINYLINEVNISRVKYKRGINRENQLSQITVFDSDLDPNWVYF